MAKKRKNARERRLEQKIQQGYISSETLQKKECSKNVKKVAAIEAPAAVPEAPLSEHRADVSPLTIRRGESVPLQRIDYAAPIRIRVAALSPLALGSGGGDVNVDSDIVRDETGLPYFPAKRLKGLLYESGLEVAEMAELSGLSLFTRADLDALFQHGCLGETQLIFSNLELADAAEMAADWRYLEERYPAIFQAQDVFETYASLRYQTKIDSATGTAADNSLRNLRVLDTPVRKGGEVQPLTFAGVLEVQPGSERAFTILALAARNLSRAGLKRTRGFGRIACTFEQEGRDILLPLVEKALEDAEKGALA